MKVDVYTATGTKKGTAELPKGLFEASVNEGLMHQALVMQQSNRRRAIAHTKGRGEISGSTRKLFQQKGTGRARRGSIRSPLLRGGGKAFGPTSAMNFSKDMPRAMRRSALKSCLSLQAQRGSIIGLENFPEAIKTKDALKLLEKLPVDLGRKILFVTADGHNALTLSVRNIPAVKTVRAAYLNPEDILVSKHIIFLVDALEKAQEVFGEKKSQTKQKNQTSQKSTAEKPKAKNAKSSASSVSSASSPSSK